MTEVAEAIEAAGVEQPIQLDRVGGMVVYSILVGFAVPPDDLQVLSDALSALRSRRT